MNNSQNYIAEKFVTPPKIVANFSEISEKEQIIENPENKVRDKFIKSGALKIFYESENPNTNDSRVERNFKSVKKKRCRDATHRDIAEDRKRIRKNIKRVVKPEIINVKRSLEKPSPLPIVKPHSDKPKPEKGYEVPQKLEPKANHCLLSKIDLSCEIKETSTIKPELQNYFLTSLKPHSSLEKKPEVVTKPKEGSSLSVHPKIPQKQTDKITNKNPVIKSTISDVGKRRINEILKSHAQKFTKIPERICILKEDVEVIKDDIYTSDSEAASDLSDNEKLSHFEAKKEEKESPKVENEPKKIKEEQPKSNATESEEKRKLPSTWANLPQSNELERRLKTTNRESSAFLFNSKSQKTDGHEKNKIQEEKKQKPANVDGIRKGKQNSDDVQKGKQNLDEVQKGKQNLDDVQKGKQNLDDGQKGKQNLDEVQKGKQNLDDVQKGKQNLDDGQKGKQNLDEVQKGRQKLASPEDNQKLKLKSVDDKIKPKPISVDEGLKIKKKLTSPEDDQKSGQKQPNADDKPEEKKTDRRETYTDRLLLLKMLGKNLEEKKKAIDALEQSQPLGQLKGPNGERLDVIAKKIPIINAMAQVKNLIQVEMVKDVFLPEKKDLSLVKVDKTIDNETVLRAKQTRSAELRDMVAQAIKDHKIFCIFDNHSYIVRPVREELLNRGWLEIIPDRRLIPRRRPPPMGPVFDRSTDKTIADRNCTTLEAILTAKQHFADEIQETVSRSPSFKYTIEKPKAIATATNISKKKLSQESVHEIHSQFCILPPNSEKKKTNVDIREFVAKYNAILERVRERENDIKKLKEKEKNAKNQKKDKPKPPSQKNKSEEPPPVPQDTPQPPLSSKRSVQEIAESIQDNKKLILNAVTEISNLDEVAGGRAKIGILFDVAQRNLLAIKDKETYEKEKESKPPPTSTYKNVYTESEARTISKIIQSANARIHFMWLSIKPAIHLKCFNYSPEIINKFQRTTFCTKIGLWSHLSNLQWYAHEVKFPAKSPRMYNTGEADDLHAFFQDFQLTACIGMLKWISDMFFEKGLKGIHAKKGKVPLRAFEFAIRQCEKYIRFRENEDLTVFEDFSVLEHEWNTFLQWFYAITNDHGKVQESSTAQIMVVYTRATDTLKLMRRYWPEIDIDGRLNIWIMKPYCASCGRGIFMTNNVYYIGQHSKYIVQKYIEKPLLIYNTKFDIRQWFLITKLTPLEVWMYKECYLRFCTQPFALRNLHESVHLSNNSVQRKYVNMRDPSLPDQNMWDSKTFQLYLRTIGQPTVWEEVIYPGMRDAIVSTMLSAQETFDGPRKSWFEVYGADFMLSSNLRDGPWLIEINENPAMDPSTKVTARLCPQMLRDVIKVVVDKRTNKSASTGQWELVYRQNYSPSFGIVNIDVKGKRIAKAPQPVRTPVDLPLPRVIPNEKKNTEEYTSSKLYELVSSLGGNQNTSTTYLEKYRNRKKLMQRKEGEQSAKTANLLKKFEKQALEAHFESSEIKIKNNSSIEEKEVE